LPASNEARISESEPRILDLRLAIYGFSFPHRGWVGILKHSIFEPGEPQCVNACGFLRRLFELLVELIICLVLVRGFGLLSQLIGRRGDVLYYVSKPDRR
jgi:hypothetical protein